MSIPCPICQNPMQQAGNPNIHTCPPRKISFPELNTVLEISHATVFLEDDKQVYQQLISGTYSFEIFDDTKQQKTVIKVLKKTKKSPYDLSKNKQFEWQELLTINAVVTLPWRNIEKVKDCVKTYIVFS